MCHLNFDVRLNLTFIDTIPTKTCLERRSCFFSNFRQFVGQLKSCSNFSNSFLDHKTNVGMAIWTKLHSTLITFSHAHIYLFCPQANINLC